MERVKIIESPRDAWQALGKVIPAAAKADYLGKLIAAGFRHLDAASFVAPARVPQMADSEAVVAALRDVGLVPGHSNGKSSDAVPAGIRNSPEIIALIVDEAGLARALKTPGVATLSYPYSVSANFRRQNSNQSLSQSRVLVERIGGAARESGKGLSVSISMAFGNPFEEPWAPEIVAEAAAWLREAGAGSVSLDDTTGSADAKAVGELLKAVREAAPGVEAGVHLHSRPENAEEKILAAYEAGCRRFDGALTGLGDCPFAADELVSNVPTETLIMSLTKHGAETGVTSAAAESLAEATRKLRREYSA